MNELTIAVAALLTCAVALMIVVLLYWKKIFSAVRVACNCMFRPRPRNSDVTVANGKCEGEDGEFPECKMAVVDPETACGSCGAVVDPKYPALAPICRRLLAMRAEVVQDVESPAAGATKVFKSLPIIREVGEVSPPMRDRRKLYTYPNSKNESKAGTVCTVFVPEASDLVQKKEVHEASASVTPLSVTFDMHKTVHIPIIAAGMVDTRSKPELRDTASVKMMCTSPPPVPESNQPIKNTGAIPKNRTSRFPLKESNQAVQLSVSVPRLLSQSVHTAEVESTVQPLSFLINTGVIRMKQNSAITDVYNSVDSDVGLVLKARDVSIDVPQEASLELENARKRFQINLDTTTTHREDSVVKLRNGFFSGLIYKKTSVRRAEPSESKLELDAVLHTSNYKSYKKAVKSRSEFRKENSAPPIKFKDSSMEKIEALRKKRIRNQTMRIGSMNDLVQENERLQVACGSPGTSNGRGPQANHM